MNFKQAYKNLKTVIKKTPLQLNKGLSKQYNCNVYLKREDLQDVRSYKIRGAYNLISGLTKKEQKKGVETTVEEGTILGVIG